ncbi:MAG TPA: hypothetical protein DCW83_14360 [Saprospirales bacterium]|nr:hypothetical protein [Saprospirales bacterium]
MAKITDPDKLSRSTQASSGTADGNVFFNLSSKTIELIDTGGWASTNELLDTNYNSGGVSIQTLYSFLKEQWKSDSELVKYAFPMEAITAEQFEFINGWVLTDFKLIRDGGFAERDAAGVVQKEYAGIISLGTLADAAGQPYFAFSDDVVKTDFQYAGQVNEPILIFTEGGTDDRANALTVFVRSAPTGSSGNVTGYQFVQTSTSDIGVTSLATQAYRFPLAQAVDPNVTLTVAEVEATGGVFDDMRIEYYTGSESITDTGTTFSVGVVIDANFDDADTSPTLTQIYQWVQNELRQSTDINVSPGDVTADVIGLLTDPLVVFVGATLKTLRQSDNKGVFIEGVGSTDLNNVEFVDNSDASQTYPFKVGVNLDFNVNILDDPNSKYFLFYTTNTGGAFGTANTVAVTKDAGGSVAGDIHTAAASYSGSMSGTSDGAIVAASRTLTVTGAAWTVNELVGKILSVDGTNIGKYYVLSNTATVITIRADGKIFDVDDATSTWSLIEPNVNGGSTPRVTFTYNYAGNVDGGRTADTVADVTLVALGLEKAQYAKAASSITKVNSVTVPVSNPLERNYDDPIGV